MLVGFNGWIYIFVSVIILVGKCAYGFFVILFRRLFKPVKIFIALFVPVTYCKFILRFGVTSFGFCRKFVGFFFLFVLKIFLRVNKITKSIIKATAHRQPNIIIVIFV